VIGYCNVAGCTTQQTHHHLDEVPERPILCAGDSDDYDRFLSTCCELGPLLKPNPAPHGPEEPCTCTEWDSTTETLAELRRQLENVEAALKRVRELHRESRGSMSALYPNPICECGKDYPCPTIAALGGAAAVNAISTLPDAYEEEQ